MEEQLYDEFGNYIGPELEDEEEGQKEWMDYEGQEPRSEEMSPQAPRQEQDNSMSIVPQVAYGKNLLHL